jgi:hypothetical protein
MPPLLTISIATYNAADLLRVTLGAALPQVREAGGKVELLVMDDGSSDDTASLAIEAQQLGPFRYIRNEKNLGTCANLISGPTRHARGEFVWCWNQHCLLYPGALARLLAILETHPNEDVFYANFRCASHPEDWPESATGGYDGPFRYHGHQDRSDRPVDRWQDVLEPAMSLGTQAYAHIVRRSIWTSFWSTRSVGESYVDALSTYPHTCMLAETVLNQPAFYVGTPLLTIFNGAQSWRDPATRARVWMLGWPDLLRIFRREGLDRSKLIAANHWGGRHAGSLAFGPPGPGRPVVRRLFFRFLLHEGLRPRVPSGLWFAFRESDRLPARALRAVGNRFTAINRYVLHDCRPARWLRGWQERKRLNQRNS